MAPHDDEISLFADRIPLEIRNKIYRYLLLAKNARAYADDCHRAIVALVHRYHWLIKRRGFVPWEEPLCARLWPCSHFRFDSAVLRANKKIYNEAIRVLYQENLFVRLSNSNGSLACYLAIGGIPTLYEGLQGSKAHSFEHCAMSVIFNDSPGAIIDEDEKFNYVIAYDDLGSFCQALLYSDATAYDGRMTLSETTFEVTVHHQSNQDLSTEPRSKFVQRRLLKPFTGLHSVLDFTITGRVDTEYASSIIARVTSPAPSIEETIDRVMSMTREARSLSDRGHQAPAIDMYKSALVQTFTRTRYLTANNVLHKGFLIGRTETFAFRYLDFMLASKIAMCHAELDEWEETHYWVCYATCNKFFPTEYAKVVYLTAWVVDAESEKAVQDLEILIDKLNTTPRGDLYTHRILRDLEEIMRSREGMDSLRDLKAVMKGLAANRDWVGDYDQE